MVDPEFEICRQKAALTNKKKKTDEDFANIAKLEWYGGIYTSNGTTPEHVVQPTSKVRKCLINTARISKEGKIVERAVSFTTLDVPLIYSGPRSIDELFADKKFHSRLSVGIRGRRIMRTRPQFYPWALEVYGILIPDAGLNFDTLKQIFELAGIVEGIGDNRVNGYGRFAGKLEKVDD
jgi:hypothetical protein